MIRVAGAFALAWLLTACAARAPYTDRYYHLDSAMAEVAAMADAPHVMLEPFDAHGLYAERQLIYRRPEGKGALEQFGYLFWSEQPTRMLTDGLEASLRAAFGDQRVHGRRSRQRAAYIVKPRLRRLEFHLQPEGAKAEFAADFVVTDEALEPLLVVRFAQTRLLSAPTAEAFADMAGQLAAQANRELIEQLAAEFNR
ncbi:ABC-type transport auxiliary lipoprotein family protein [Panacagrimonas sp.]|uniref:ABC-type transport auxiliary lipoprotein family protein n=1 Tax=Panacagrimonas sp. TaxID=2480088 RepID=UPI003B518143